MIGNIDILQAMQDPELFGKLFQRRFLRGDSWKAWRAFLAVLFGLSLDDDAREIYERHTGRTDTPAARFREAFVVAGRRSGKSLIAALVATFLACFKNYADVITPGETGVVIVLAADRRQARVILGYINGFFDAVPMLNRLVTSRLKESIELSNNIRIEIHTSSFRAVRGYTIVGAICDELAFWPAEDSASPDVEVLNALRPGMATVPDALLLGISSPYARRGALWEAHRENFGKNEAPVLVWHAATREMNPTVSELLIRTAYLRDHVAASAEYGAQFRDDVESFISQEMIERAVVHAHELPPRTDIEYIGFVDPSGGQSDSMTLGIAHFEREKAVLDSLHERRAPFSPESVCDEFAAILKSYRIGEVEGDRYAGEWPREQFQKRGILYRVSERNRSELYLELLPALMSGNVELIANNRLVMQLVSLERRTARGGRDTIDHAPGGHDDCANVVAGAIARVLRGQSHVYGVLELAKTGWSGFIDDCQGIKESFRAGRAEAKPDAKETAGGCCPDCGAPLELQALVAGGMLRCNQCGAQRWPPGVTPPALNFGIGRPKYGSKFIIDEYSRSPRSVRK